MQEERVSPTEVTVACILQACSKVGSLPMDIARKVDDSLICTGNALSPLVANTLISTYGRCTSMPDAQAVFDAMPQHDVVSWNALSAGYAREGNCVASLQCYNKMGLAGIKPDGVTFLTLLSACSHVGLVGRGVEYFHSMSRDHDIAPEISHYVTMVDLLGRAGCFTSLGDLLSSNVLLTSSPSN